MGNSWTSSSNSYYSFSKSFRFLPDRCTSVTAWLKRLVSVASLEPAIDPPSLHIVPLGEFSLRDAIFVRYYHKEPLCRLLSFYLVERILQVLDGNPVEMIHSIQQRILSKQF